MIVRVLVGADGQVKKANILKSSGFDRLDHAAAKGVLSWRFVPGKRGGVPEEMWTEQPVTFVMDDF